jgi:GTPase SAR1 family protein
MQQQQQVDFKLLVIGDSSVGKSSLLLRSSDSQWRLENGTSPTVAIDYRVSVRFSFELQTGFHVLLIHSCIRCK